MSTLRQREIADRSAEAILDAAENLLAQSEDPSISAVARRAGLSRPTVYAHFPDRERLLTAVAERSAERWKAATEALDTNDDPPLEALARLIEAGWRHADRANANSAAGVHALVVRGRRDGSIRADMPTEWLVSAIYALVDAAIGDTRTGRLDALDAERCLLRSLPDLLRAPEPQSS